MYCEELLVRSFKAAKVAINEFVFYYNGIPINATFFSCVGFIAYKITGDLLLNNVLLITGVWS